ncbi:CCAAT/enhancer-binding protein zeta-like [Notothenia coriiceps]|uniref:CCAAT/enhancer-binding protein zeta-like n=1 Tax=Notothenia coriiceps TaxID=8208 RepID=A0A6I9NT18_9TELE|nr:PREDICTED: CCAAT/enhancer-binding protein zeta-like [Notothenia coriiceps]
MADDDLDFAGNVKAKKKKKKDAEASDSDDDDSDADLDDEEVSLGSMDQEDFGDELEEEGGTFMDPDGGGEDDDDEEGEATFLGVAGSYISFSRRDTLGVT